MHAGASAKAKLAYEFSQLYAEYEEGFYNRRLDMEPNPCDEVRPTGRKVCFGDRHYDVVREVRVDYNAMTIEELERKKIELQQYREDMDQKVSGTNI